jgi:hypothetical protein
VLLNVGEPTGRGPVTVTPERACEVIVDVEPPEDADAAELGEPPHATRTTLKHRPAENPRAMCQRPCLRE